MKLVSIIVPVYNRSNAIVYCYNSLINQTYKNLEIIFVDDGSTDNTLDILNSFKDKRVKVIHQANAGPSEARRTGFDKSLGEYILFIDSDDTIGLDFTEKLVNTLENTHSFIASGRIGLHVNYPLIKYFIFNSKKKPEDIYLSKNKEYLPALHQGIVGKLFKRDILKLEKNTFRANEDLIIMYPLFAKVDHISINNKAIYHNYYSRNSQRNLLFGYRFETIYNTFGTLNILIEEYKKLSLYDNYYHELEMLFIRNIFERINNIKSNVKNKEYLYKFINLLLDYLEYYFPKWEQNTYYIGNFVLGEITDRLRIKNAKKIIKKINHIHKNYSIDEIYHRYKLVVNEYEMYLKSEEK